MNFTDLLNSITLLGGKIKAKLALKLDKTDIEGRGLLTSLDMTTGAGLALAQALPGALYGKGLIVGRARATELGLIGPVATGNKTGVLKIFAEASGATGTTPFNAIRREFSGSSGLMFTQYAIDATTWSAWVGVAALTSTVQSALQFNIAPNVTLTDTPSAITAAYGAVFKATAQVYVRATDDTGLTGELIVSNIATLDPLWALTNTDVGILTVWAEANGSNSATSPKVQRELLINGRTLQSSGVSNTTTWSAWTLKREIANTITISTAAPSGGSDGDIWMQYS